MPSEIRRQEYNRDPLAPLLPPVRRDPARASSSATRERLPSLGFQPAWLRRLRSRMPSSFEHRDAMGADRDGDGRWRCCSRTSSSNGTSRLARRRDEEQYGDDLRRGRRRGASAASSARPIELGPSGERGSNQLCPRRHLLTLG